ncbi:MAG: hypothetical protein ACRD3S_01685, partial [Terracidiphilus sp.]
MFYLDTDLLRRLAQEKLAKRAAQVEGDGHAWVHVALHMDYAERARYRSVGRIEREATRKENRQLKTQEGKLKELEEQLSMCSADDEQIGDLEVKIAQLEEDRDALHDALMMPDPEQAALVGALVSIDREGKIKIETGLMKPEDAERFIVTGRKSDSQAQDRPMRTHSAALLLKLTAHRTLALRAELARKPEVTLAALAHHLVLVHFFENSGHADDVLKVKAEAVPLDRFAKDLAGTKANAILEETRERLRSRLPANPAQVLVWMLQQPETTLAEYIAFCVAQSVDAVANHERESSADALADAVRIDMRQWWTPTA